MVEIGDSEVQEGKYDKVKFAEVKFTKKFKAVPLILLTTDLFEWPDQLPVDLVITSQDVSLEGFKIKILFE